MSSGFTLDGIEDVFREDVLRLTGIMRRGLTQLLEQPDDARTVDEVRGNGHSLKGAASLVGLQYLSRCGATLERMTDVASTFVQAEPGEALGIFSAMLGALEVVERLLEVCLARGDEKQQRALYRDFCGAFSERARAYLEEEETEEEELEPEVKPTAVHFPGEGGEPAARAASEKEQTTAPGAEEVTEEEAFAQELAEVFALELQEQVQSIPDEVKRLGPTDTRGIAAKRLSRIFHTIKGSAAMVGLTDLSETSRRLETFFEDPELLATSVIDEAQADLDAIFAAANVPPPELAAVVALPEAARAPEELALERELLEAFNIDATEGIERSEQILLSLEQRPDDKDLLHGLFRQFHTLKGAAGAVGLDRVAAQLHEGESLLESVLEGEVSVEAGKLVDFLFRLTDSVVGLINQVRGIQDPRRQIITDIEDALADLCMPEAEVAAEAALSEMEAPKVFRAPAAPPEAPPAMAREAEAGVVRVQAARLDALLNQVGQLVVTRTRMDQKVLSFADLRDRLEYCRRRLADTIEGFQRRFEYTIGEPYSMPRPATTAEGGEAERRAGGAGVDDFFTDLEFDKYDDFNILARSVIELATDTGEVANQLDQFIEALGEEVREFSKITSGLQHQITNLRLMPIELVYRRLLRPVRDTARQEGKLVDLRFEGGDVQLDRGVIEGLYTPLLHVVRNAVSHGIEPPGRREVCGKSSTGTIRISASARHNSVTIAVADDGAGIDFESIRQEAVRLKLLEAAAVPSQEQLLSFIFRPGFSTAETVTDISGRGVGMDVVARQVAALNGSVLVDSREGHGTTMRLALPITTSIDEVLVLDVGEQTFALPVDFIERVVGVEVDQLEQIEGQWLVPVGDERFPALFLGPLVGEALPEGNSVGVVLRGGERAIVLVVDRVRGQQEVVLRPLNRLLEAHPFLSASTISGGGAVIFVLHVGRLFELAGVAAERWVAPEVEAEAEAAEVVPPPPARAVLMVDDSISVRKLAVRFIESEGLEVETAVDGVDALEKLKEGRFRVVVTDLEMPRMHGYDLIEAIKTNPQLAHIPVIVCTSRASEKHRRRAQDLGAEGYVTKPFSKEEIIAEIMRVTEWYQDPAGATGTSA
jgi:chemosensory pili system protein ChpA (sensor histidine kinase/response regulator)